MLALTGLNTHAVYSQKIIKDYVIEKSMPINTIEPDSNNYTDLKPIGDAIGDDRIVMLGEQDHGDAPTFLAKTRLIKYLHEKKGFNVLAFESDFFGLNEGWDKLEKAQPKMNDFIFQNIFGIWTLCNTCSNLFYQYIPHSYKTNQPLILTGFDSQQYLDYSFHNLKGRLDSMLRSKDVPITRQDNYTSEILPLIDSSKKWNFVAPKNIGGINNCLHYLRTIKDQLTPLVSENDFWLLVIDNLIQQVAGVKLKFDTGKEAVNERDIQMAKNLKWLIENKFKDQKIIVWAASEHIARSLKNLKYSPMKNAITMGEQLVENISKEKRFTYSALLPTRVQAEGLDWNHIKFTLPGKIVLKAG